MDNVSCCCVNVKNFMQKFMPCEEDDDFFGLSSNHHQLLQASFAFTESIQLNQPALFFDQKRAQKEALRAVLSCEGTIL
ncbi:hypothetical protein Psal072_01756 [Piscirickettsia salmonis]|nr:hypothetical protein Psal006a_01544 [Piscirickettsia salmonis]QGO62960.1 hypothetical protein Psal072_01756 [Piscirickettsia salmonis]QGP43123.1 hypothetical protein Psal103_01761 [Piscirickettsia salmonis]